jgi:hypothetical protein
MPKRMCLFQEYPSDDEMYSIQFKRTISHQGQHAKKNVFIPRIPLYPSDDEMYSIQFKRTISHQVKLYHDDQQGKGRPFLMLVPYIWYSHTVNYMQLYQRL